MKLLQFSFSLRRLMDTTIDRSSRVCSSEWSGKIRVLQLNTDGSFSTAALLLDEALREYDVLLLQELHDGGVALLVPEDYVVFGVPSGWGRPLWERTIEM